MPRPLVLIVGMLATKDSAGFLRNFSGLARRVVRGADPGSGEEPAGRSARWRRRASVGIPARGLRQRRGGARRDRRGSRSTAPPRILITGSLYLAGEVLARNGTPPE